MHAYVSLFDITSCVSEEIWEEREIIYTVIPNESMIKCV